MLLSQTGYLPTSPIGGLGRGGEGPARTDRTRLRRTTSDSKNTAVLVLTSKCVFIVLQICFVILSLYMTITV